MINKIKFVKYLFITSIVVSNVAAYKLVSIFGLIGPGGVILAAVSFLCTDIISELEGKEASKELVKYGLITALVASFMLTLVDILPYPVFAEERAIYFGEVAGSSIRIMLSGLTAYIVSQNLDLYLFHSLKNKYSSKKWVRNNFSTIVSQLFDTVVFCTLAFIGSVPLTELLSIIIGQYVIKLGLAIIDTPLFYFFTKESK